MSFTSPMTGLIRFSVSNQKPTVKLFRDICKELPRVMTIFDLDLPEKQVLQYSRAKKDTDAVQNTSAPYDRQSPTPADVFPHFLQVRSHIASKFRANGFVKDERVVKMLVSKGYAHFA